MYINVLIEVLECEEFTPSEQFEEIMDMLNVAERTKIQVGNVIVYGTLKLDSGLDGLLNSIENVNVF